LSLRLFLTGYGNTVPCASRGDIGYSDGGAKD
jgi:hypothetical protein